jgi:hypothetical protein
MLHETLFSFCVVLIFGYVCVLTPLVWEMLVMDKLGILGRVFDISEFHIPHGWA